MPQGDTAMGIKTIDGKCFAKMLHGAAAMLSSHAGEVNDLNVFPVPDGDTGTNMAKTIEGGLSEISSLDTESIGQLSDRFAHGALLGARGNSGVILSQIFAGIGEELSKHDTADAKILATAFECGIKKAYSAVLNPTEGTLLTVFRESTEYASANINENSTVEDFLRLHIEKARASLEHTKELLPVLAEADVVDSGGAGYLYIIIGMYEVLTGKMENVVYTSTDNEAKVNVDISKFGRDSKLEFGYCTEFLLRLMSDRTDPDSFDIQNILDVLGELGGESIVAYKTDDIIKVHVHTMTPGDILSRMQGFGEFLTVKIENMSLSHTSEVKPQSVKKKKISTIAVASGEGVCALFTEMGADRIISGGQTQNPSAQEFLDAFTTCNSENIIVLPNNKNVFLAAKQAAELYDGAKIHIVPTKNLMQGYGALSVINPGVSDVEDIVNSAQRAAESVIGSEITRAVRDVSLGGKAIKEGDYIAITDGEISAVSSSANDAVLDMLSSLDMDEYEIITLFVGSEVDDRMRVELTERIEEAYPDCELEVHIGGQEVYDYMVAVE